MISFTAELERFEKMGEKTGWTFIYVPMEISQQIKPGCRKSYRVKGKLDDIEINGLSLLPMGEGNFLLALKASLRKSLRKEEGAVLQIQLEEDKDFKIEMPEDLELCLLEEKHTMDFFMKLPKTHQNYFIAWLNTAKTEPTRLKRLTQIVIAMDQEMNFIAMVRSNAAKR